MEYWLYPEGRDIKGSEMHLFANSANLFARKVLMSVVAAVEKPFPTYKETQIRSKPVARLRLKLFWTCWTVIILI